MILIAGKWKLSGDGAFLIWRIKGEAYICLDRIDWAALYSFQVREVNAAIPGDFC